MIFADGATCRSADLEIRGEERFGYKVLTVSNAAVPNGVAAICLWAEDRPDPGRCELQWCHFPGVATLAKMAWPSSAGLVNCGQWPVGRSM
jgi:hypothetical protein